jgi:hypothetical protein
VYVSAVTPSLRCPTKRPISAQLRPCRWSRLILRCLRSCGENTGTPAARQARAIAVRRRLAPTVGNSDASSRGRRAARSSPRSPRRERPGARPTEQPASSSSTPGAAPCGPARRSRRRGPSRPRRPWRPTSQATETAAGRRAAAAGRPPRHVRSSEARSRQAPHVVGGCVCCAQGCPRALLVEHRGEVLHRLADRLALASARGELRHHRVDVVDRELVDAPRAENREHAGERHTVQDSGSFAHVDPRVAPPAHSLRDRRRLRGRRERTEVGDAAGSEFAVDPTAPLVRLPLRPERAAVAGRAVAAAEAVLDAVALLAPAFVVRVMIQELAIRLPPSRAGNRVGELR